MDGTQDGLTGGSKFSQETDNVEGALTVETGSRLVQEEQELGLGSQLDTDGKSLSSFDTETVTRETNHGVGEILEFQQFEDFLNIVVLFRLGDVGGLTEVGRVSHGFTNSGSPFVNVLLFDIGGTLLESDVGSSTVDLDITTDDTGSLSCSEDIQKGGLSGTCTKGQTRFQYAGGLRT